MKKQCHCSKTTAVLGFAFLPLFRDASGGGGVKTGTVYIL